LFVLLVHACGHAPLFTTIPVCYCWPSRIYGYARKFCQPAGRLVYADVVYSGASAAGILLTLSRITRCAQLLFGSQAAFMLFNGYAAFAGWPQRYLPLVAHLMMTSCCTLADSVNGFRMFGSVCVCRCGSL